jgi:hypothetical protein
MPRVSTCLNFPRSTEAAFSFYKAVFKTEYAAPIARFKDVPPQHCMTMSLAQGGDDLGAMWGKEMAVLLRVPALKAEAGF